MLFLIDVGHANVETAKRTRRYLLAHRRILKKGRLFHILRKSNFSKGERRLEFCIVLDLHPRFVSTNRAAYKLCLHRAK